MNRRRRTAPARAWRRLAELYLADGYARVPSERLEEGWERYKKGWEVRFVVDSRAEAHDVVRLLDAVGIRAGAVFRKARRWAVPIYGREAVEAIRRRALRG